MRTSIAAPLRPAPARHAVDAAMTVEAAAGSSSTSGRTSETDLRDILVGDALRAVFQWP